MTDRTPGFATLAVHAGAQPDPTTGARATPIYQTTSFVFDDVDHAASLFNLQTYGYIYSRLTNPTVSVLEERVATLESGRGAIAVASGHAAQMLAFFSFMEPGDQFIAVRQPAEGHGQLVLPPDDPANQPARVPDDHCTSDDGQDQSEDRERGGPVVREVLPSQDARSRYHSHDHQPGSGRQIRGSPRWPWPAPAVSPAARPSGHGAAGRARPAANGICQDAGDASPSSVHAG